MEKNTKQVKAARAKAEEAALNRILCWIAGGAVLEFLLLLLRRYWDHYTVDQIELRVALGTTVKVLAVCALICAGAAFFWWRSARKADRGAAVPGVLGLFMAGVSVSCFAAWFFSSLGLQLMCVAVPVVIVLAMVYYLYQREFLLVACQGVLALLAAWICGKGLGGAQSPLCYVYVIAAALLVLAGAGVCRKAQEDKGRVEFRGGKVRLFPQDANYAMLYVSAVVTLAVLVLSLFGVPQMALYAVTVAWLLIMAVYYTVKLM